MDSGVWRQNAFGSTYIVTKWHVLRMITIKNY